MISHAALRSIFYWNVVRPVLFTSFFSTPAVISVLLPYFGSSRCGAAFIEGKSRSQ